MEFADGEESQQIDWELLDEDWGESYGGETAPASEEESVVPAALPPALPIPTSSAPPPLASPLVMRRREESHASFDDYVSAMLSSERGDNFSIMSVNTAPVAASSQSLYASGQGALLEDGAEFSQSLFSMIQGEEQRRSALAQSLTEQLPDEPFTSALDYLRSAPAIFSAPAYYEKVYDHAEAAESDLIMHIGVDPHNYAAPIEWYHFYERMLFNTSHPHDFESPTRKASPNSKLGEGGVLKADVKRRLAKVYAKRRGWINPYAVVRPSEAGVRDFRFRARHMPHMYDAAHQEEAVALLRELGGSDADAAQLKKLLAEPHTSVTDAIKEIYALIGRDRAQRRDTAEKVGNFARRVTDIFSPIVLSAAGGPELTIKAVAQNLQKVLSTRSKFAQVIKQIDMGIVAYLDHVCPKYSLVLPENCYCIRPGGGRAPLNYRAPVWTVDYIPASNGDGAPTIACNLRLERRLEWTEAGMSQQLTPELALPQNYTGEDYANSRFRPHYHDAVRALQWPFVVLLGGPSDRRDAATRSNTLRYDSAGGILASNINAAMGAAYKIVRGTGRGQYREQFKEYRLMISIEVCPQGVRYMTDLDGVGGLWGERTMQAPPSILFAYSDTPVDKILERGSGSGELGTGILAHERHHFSYHKKGESLGHYLFSSDTFERAQGDVRRSGHTANIRKGSTQLKATDRVVIVRKRVAQQSTRAFLGAEGFEKFRADYMRTGKVAVFPPAQVVHDAYAVYDVIRHALEARETWAIRYFVPEHQMDAEQNFTYAMFDEYRVDKEFVRKDVHRPLDIARVFDVTAQCEDALDETSLTLYDALYGPNIELQREAISTSHARDVTDVDPAAGFGDAMPVFDSAAEAANVVADSAAQSGGTIELGQLNTLLRTVSSVLIPKLLASVSAAQAWRRLTACPEALTHVTLLDYVAMRNGTTIQLNEPGIIDRHLLVLNPDSGPVERSRVFRLDFVPPFGGLPRTIANVPMSMSGKTTADVTLVYSVDERLVRRTEVTTSVDISSESAYYSVPALYEWAHEGYKSVYARRRGGTYALADDVRISERYRRVVEFNDRHAEQLNELNTPDTQSARQAVLLSQYILPALRDAEMPVENAGVAFAEFHLANGRATKSEFHAEATAKGFEGEYTGELGIAEDGTNVYAVRTKFIV